MNQHILDEVKQLRHELHLIPEQAFEEKKTKACLMDHIGRIKGIEVIDCGPWFYAVYRPDTQAENAAPIAFRADFDAVTGSDGKPGHFCGHDGHAAILTGFAEEISEIKPDRVVYFIFQPAEEIGQGALLCRKLIKDKSIAEIYGFHNIPGYPEGSVLICPQTFACASTGLMIKITGAASHAAYPEAGKNPAGIIAELILAAGVLSEKYCKRGLAFITVIGADIGSRAYGVSAGAGELRVTLRAEKQEDFDGLLTEITGQTQKLTMEAGMTCSIEKIEEFPATVNHEAGVKKLISAAEKKQLKTIIPPEPFRWSEDFGYYLQETEGAFFGIGDGENWPQLHTAEYEFPDAIIGSVLKMYEALVCS